MGPNRQGLVAVVYDISTPNLVRGADCFVTTQVQYADAAAPSPMLSPGGGDPYAFQSFVGSTAYFPGSDGTPVAASGALESVDLGTVRFAVAADVSSGLQVGDSLQFEQVLVDARGKTILLIDGLTVVAAPLAAP